MKEEEKIDKRTLLQVCDDEIRRQIAYFGSGKFVIHLLGGGVTIFVVLILIKEVLNK